MFKVTVNHLHFKSHEIKINTELSNYVHNSNPDSKMNVHTNTSPESNGSDVTQTLPRPGQMLINAP